MAAKQGLELPESIYQQVIEGIRLADAPTPLPAQVHRRAGAGVVQVQGINPQFTPQTPRTLANLFIQSHSKSKMGVMR